MIPKFRPKGSSYEVPVRHEYVHPNTEKNTPEADATGVFKYLVVFNLTIVNWLSYLPSHEYQLKAENRRMLFEIHLLSNAELQGDLSIFQKYYLN